MCQSVQISVLTDCGIEVDLLCMEPSTSGVQGRNDGGGISVYIPSQNQSLKIILCTNCSRCRQAASIQDGSIVQ